MAKRKEKSKPAGPAQSERFKKWTKWLWMFYGVGLLILLFIIIGFTFTDLPDFDELENPEIDYASIVYDRDGEELGKYYVENRVAVSYDDLNPKLVNALIATEDARFYSHSGIDFRALMRVIFKTVLLGQRSSGGGSTITQQLAKLLYSNRSLSTDSKLKFYAKIAYYKIREWITAVRLEKSYTKEEIIAMYLSEYDFIYGAHGVEAAALTYFGKSQSELNLEEAAMLVGMLKNSVLYNPVKYPENALNRRNVVLQQMYREEVLSEEEKNELQAKPLNVQNFEQKSHLTGRATYFRASLAEWTKQLIKDREIKDADGNYYNIYKDGLKIYTTIDNQMQMYLEKAAQEHMKSLQKKFFRHWADKDIWEYEEEIGTEVKLDRLNKQIRASNRYYQLKKEYFIPSVVKVEKEYELTFHDYDMDRLLKAESDSDYIDRLRAANLVSKKKAKIYRSILKGDLWQELKAAWEKLQSETEKSFNKKVKMQVFAYNEAGVKDTLMTPLDSIKYHRMILQVGSMAMDPRNGEVRAWLGGPDYTHYKYDHVSSARQVGSTFKPFVYATAIAFQGFSPCQPVTDVQYEIHKGEGNFGLIKNWKPQNSDGKYTNDNITLYQALKESKNSVSVYLMKQLGDVNPVLTIIDNMGLDTGARLSNGRFKIPRQPSICLGAADLTVFEMTGAYGTFANEGRYNKPIFVSKIEDRNGKVIYRAVPESQVALNKDVNYVMVQMLKKAVGGVSWKLKSDWGGKTGTTNDHSDGWFMGITPDLVVGTWVGGEDIWVRFRSLRMGQGSRMARPLYTTFMKYLEANEDEFEGFSTSSRFDKPKDLSITLECEEFKDEGQEEQKERTLDDFFEG